MRRIIITALIALTALGGVASADRGHRGHRDRNNGGIRVERSYPRQSYRQNYRVYPRTYQRNTYYRPRVRVVRQPIYVQRPVISYRYTNFYQRPVVIAENYPSRPGYIWITGQWQWNGYEWTWTAGHYQPDPAYQQYWDGQQYYDSQGDTYDSSQYYDPSTGQYYNY